jgi:nitroreductase
MEFRDAVRRRHMIRSYDGRPLPHDVLERIVDAGRRAPSAGNTQGTEFLVLEGPEQTARFWEVVVREPERTTGRWAGMRTAAAIVVPLSNKQAYLDRYAEPDKAGLGLEVESGWSLPYWDIDAAFAVMLMLLAATDEGVGALFFAVTDGEVLDQFAVPSTYRPIGAVTLGYPAATLVTSPSLARGHRTDTVHWGRWTAADSGG